MKHEDIIFTSNKSRMLLLLSDLVYPKQQQVWYSYSQFMRVFPVALYSIAVDGLVYEFTNRIIIVIFCTISCSALFCLCD